jgi:hypothetical protein
MYFTTRAILWNRAQFSMWESDFKAIINVCSINIHSINRAWEVYFIYLALCEKAGAITVITESLDPTENVTTVSKIHLTVESLRYWNPSCSIDSKQHWNR